MKSSPFGSSSTSAPASMWITLMLAIFIALPTVGFAQAVAESRPIPQIPLSPTPGGTVLQGTAVVPAAAAIVDMREAARRDALTPQPLGPLVPRRLQGKTFDPAEPIDPASTHGAPVSLAPPPPSLNVASPSPSMSFKGLGDIAIGGTTFIVIPPDVDGAVGRSKILESLNNNYQVFDKCTGDTLATISTNAFWAASGGTINSYFDPKTLYDPINDRWIVCMLSDGFTASSSIVVGVSQTDDPQGAYHIFRVDMDAANTLTADFPSIGFNQNWVAIGLNMFTIAGGTFSTGRMLVIDYGQLRSGTFVGTVFSGTGFCSSPSATYSAVENTLYVPTHLSSGGGTYRLDTITGTPAAPVYTVGGTLSRGLTWAQAGGNALPQAPPLLGASACVSPTPCRIEAQDAQIRSTPVVKGGFLYYSQTVGLPAGAFTRTGVQWTKLNLPSGTVADGGRIEDPTATATNGGKWYAWSNVAVNGAGDIMVGYSQFASNQFGAAGYSMHLAADAPGTMRDPLIFKAGEDYYHKTFNTTTGRNRWGDYSKVQVDPVDDLTLWTVQEYAGLRNGTDDGNAGSNSSRWGTYWAAVAGTPVVTIAPGPSQSEGHVGLTPFVFTVTLSAASGVPVTVSYQVVDGTATLANNDYVAASGSITICPPLTSGTITVNGVGDSKFEGDETFTVGLTGATNGVVGIPGSATGTILNDDTQPTLSIDDVKVIEGNGGSIAAVFTVTLSNPTDQSVSVDFQTYDRGASVANDDYEETHGTLVIPPKTLTGQITVTVNGDLTFEGDENFHAILSAPVNATIADDAGLGTISNDDTEPTLAIDDVKVIEGNAGTLTAVFTVTLSNPTGGFVSVDFQTYDRTATVANNDYEETHGTLVIPPKTLTGQISVKVNGDLKFEGDETYHLILSNAVGATIADDAGLGTISNDDTQPTVSIDDVKVIEGNAGSIAAVFTVTLSNPTDQSVSVDFQTYDRSASVANDDYEETHGTLVIPPKTLTGQISVKVNGDLKFEGDETYHLILSNAVGATIADDAGLGTISNDDTQPTVSIDDVTQVEGHVGATLFVFTVTLSNPTDQAVTVAFQTADGSATLADNDYVQNSGSIVILPKTLREQITVVVNGDLTNEPDETFSVDLLAAVNATLADNQGKGTIVNDDDTGLPAVTVDAPNGGESYTIGDPVKLKWTATDNVGVTAIDLYLSRSGPGGPFDIIALGEPNDGTYSWVATGPVTVQAILEVVAHDAAGNTGDDASDGEWTIHFPAAVALSLFEAEPGSGEVTLRWQLAGSEELSASWVERAEQAAGPWSRVGTEAQPTAGVNTVVDRGVEAGRSYVYRLVAQHWTGGVSTFGPIQVTAGALAGDIALSIVPNPTPGSARIDYTVPRVAHVRISIVDLQGRGLVTLVDAVQQPGSHQARWDGKAAKGPVPPGLYFVRYETGLRTLVKRVMVTR